MAQVVAQAETMWVTLRRKLGWFEGRLPPSRQRFEFDGAIHKVGANGEAGCTWTSDGPMRRACPTLALIVVRLSTPTTPRIHPMALLRLRERRRGRMRELAATSGPTNRSAPSPMS